MIEVLVVIAIFAIVAGLGMYASMDSYRGSNFRNDRNLLIAALQRARAQSINNICLGTCTDGKVHGVAIRPGGVLTYVIFQTSSDYAGREADSQYDVIFPSTPTTIITPATAEITFERLTGNSTFQTIQLDGGGKTSVIEINLQGRISWTN